MLPGAAATSCSTRPTGSPSIHPIGCIGPGFLIGDGKDLILWGFTAGLDRPALRPVGLDAAVGPRTVERELPDDMLG